MMEYKGYVAMVEFDDAADIFHGEVVNSRAVITFQGRSADELRREFHTSVDVYLDWCGERGKEPEKPFSGKFMVRVEPGLHREIFIAAKHAHKSLNAWVRDALAVSVHGQPAD